MKRALVLLALVMGCDRSSPSDVDTAESAMISNEPTRVRVVAANLSSGVNQSYDPGHGARILQAIAPDIVLLQELSVGDGSDAALRTWVDATFGTDFAVHREAGSMIPNGLVSRWPIVEDGEWTDPSTSGTRDFAWAHIALPGARDLWAVSVHFKAVPREAPKRADEARALVAAINAKIPSGDLLVVGGDFNTEKLDEPCFTELAAILDTAPPYPADVNGVTGTNASRKVTYDFVFASPALDGDAVPVDLLGGFYPNGLVFDTRVATAPPALTDDSAAMGMQHMAVVRDFVVPSL